MNTHLINALGQTLVHFLWEGAALALLLVLFSRGTARLRYAAACAALFLMPVAFGLTFVRLWRIPALATQYMVPRLAAVPDLSAASNNWTAAASSPLWEGVVPLWIAGGGAFS